jgi:hypothetical protein
LRCNSKEKLMNFIKNLVLEELGPRIVPSNTAMIPLDYAGNTMAAARDVGTLSLVPCQG